MVMKATDWAERIQAAWHKSVDAIFEVGNLLIGAKKALPHGQFEKMIEQDLPFGVRTAQMLMAIAQDERLQKAKQASLLPPSWYLLYRLTQVSDVVFNAALSGGLINAEMNRKDLAGLSGQIPPPIPPAPISFVLARAPSEPSPASEPLPAPEPPRAVTVNYTKAPDDFVVERPSYVAEARPAPDPDRGEAYLLLGALCDSTHNIRRLVAEILLSERSDDIASVRDAVAELATLLAHEPVTHRQRDEADQKEI